MSNKKTAAPIKTKTAKAKVAPKRIVKEKPPTVYSSIGQVKRAMAKRRLGRGVFTSVTGGGPALAAIKLRIGSAKGGTVFEGTLESVLSRLLKEKGLKVDFDVALPALPTSSAS